MLKNVDSTDASTKTLETTNKRPPLDEESSSFSDPTLFFLSLHHVIKTEEFVDFLLPTLMSRRQQPVQSFSTERIHVPFFLYQQLRQPPLNVQTALVAVPSTECVNGSPFPPPPPGDNVPFRMRQWSFHSLAMSASMTLNFPSTDRVKCHFIPPMALSFPSIYRVDCS